MKTAIRHAIALFLLVIFVQTATADVSGSWTFAVALGDAGSGNADVSLTQQADGKLAGTYAGQLTNGPIAGTYEGDKFEFSFNSPALGADLTYRGELAADGTIKGAVVAGGQDIGTFVGTKK